MHISCKKEIFINFFLQPKIQDYYFLENCPRIDDNAYCGMIGHKDYYRASEGLKMALK